MANVAHTLPNIIDHSGRKMLPIGRDGFVPAAEACALVDKTMLIAEILNSGYTATLFCRPRRFGKTLNMTMLRAFFEIPYDGRSVAHLFEGTAIWDAEGGRYRSEQGRYPVVYLSFNTVKKDSWEVAYADPRDLIAREYDRHAHLLASEALSERELGFVRRIIEGSASETEFSASLAMLTRMLFKHHGVRPIVLIDEYDAPVMAAFSAPNGGYYSEVVSFLKGLLTGALKDGGEALAFACLTGVQRISKESIFSDLNNLVVNTTLSSEFDEYFGFTQEEVEALADYLGLSNHLYEAKAWYDGYRFGKRDIYNPWSVLNYFKQGCVPGTYWSNTSGNSVIEAIMARLDDKTLTRLSQLLAPDGKVTATLNLTEVFPDLGVRSDAIWSMLYLAGYLTTDFTDMPDRYVQPRPLRIPNREVGELFRMEIIERFGSLAGGMDELDEFRRALVQGDSDVMTKELGRIAMTCASAFDLVSENACHMLLLGLCFGLPGYADPRSNREAGYGRYDIQIEPAGTLAGMPALYEAEPVNPCITIELKYSSEEGFLDRLADEALLQIRERAYDAELLAGGVGTCLHWGIAFSGKHVVAKCEWVRA